MTWQRNQWRTVLRTELVGDDDDFSQFGLVPAVDDPKTKLVSYTFTQKLVPQVCIVTLTVEMRIE